MTEKNLDAILAVQNLHCSQLISHRNYYLISAWCNKQWQPPLLHILASNKSQR